MYQDKYAPILGLQCDMGWVSLSVDRQAWIYSVMDFIRKAWQIRSSRSSGRYGTLLHCDYKCM